MKDKGLGVDIILNDIQSNPCCTHGPTILFERFQGNGVSRRYFACSACRERSLCSFYHIADQPFSKAKENIWNGYIKDGAPKIAHHDLSDMMSSIQKLEPRQRGYCFNCNVLFGTKKTTKHQNHKVLSPVTDEQLQNPSTILAPRDNARFEAQYLFTKQSTEILLGMLKQLKAKKVLCLGTPRIFEAISSNATDNGMSALLMDIDDRFKSFFPPEKFVHYNMFNHHFFGGKKAKKVYEDFLAGGEDLVLISDPPFGGRMELLGHNIKTIQNDWNSFNQMEMDSSSEEVSVNRLPVLFIFPYFMEPQVLENLPNFTMMDYQVDYDNHPLYSKGPKGMMHGSAVRVFTNDRPSLFVLPESMGYRNCTVCDRWVRTNNPHCEKCKGCMSKDGKTYIHCDTCAKCVKPSWIHCSACSKCHPKDHRCDISGVDTTMQFVCHICGVEGHKRMDCPQKKKSHEDIKAEKKKQKLSAIDNGDESMDISSDTLSKRAKKKMARSMKIGNQNMLLLMEAKKKEQQMKEVMDMDVVEEKNSKQAKKQMIMKMKAKEMKENIAEMKAKAKKMKKAKKNPSLTVFEKIEKKKNIKNKLQQKGSIKNIMKKIHKPGNVKKNKGKM